MTRTENKPAEELADIVADLITDANRGRFLSRLFAAKAGEWINLTDATCGLNGDVVRRIAEIRMRDSSDLTVAWLDHPDVDKGFCVILFLSTWNLRSSMVVFNKMEFTRLAQSI